MRFDLDLAIHIATHLQDQDFVLARINQADIPSTSDDEEPWQLSERLEAHLLLMQDAGWVDSVEIFTADGTWQARLNYQGHLWVDAYKNQGIMQRARDAVRTNGLHAANTVIAEIIKTIVSTAAS